MEPIHVLVTGAAGQIGYALSFRIAAGDLFGKRKIILHLLDIKPAMQSLEGCAMELQDCAFSTLAKVIFTDDVELAFKDVEIAFLVGSMPRKQGMDRSDLLGINGGIFTVQGKALNDFSNPNVKCLVVGNPANTNCAIAMHSAPKLGVKNFSSMSRLDLNRMKGELAVKLNCYPEEVKHCILWGNHSNTMVPDATHATFGPKNLSVVEHVEPGYLENEFVKKISTRGGEVIKTRGASSAASAAAAAIDQMKSWVYGTGPDEWVSMSVPVPDNEPYGVKKGIVYSFPVTIDEQGVHIIEGLKVTKFIQDLIKVSEDELQKEKEAAWKVLNL